MIAALTAEEAYVAAFQDVRAALQEADAAKAVGIICDYEQMVREELVSLWQARIDRGELPPMHAPHMAMAASEAATVVTTPTEVC